MSDSTRGNWQDSTRFGVRNARVAQPGFAAELTGTYDSTGTGRGYPWKRLLLDTGLPGLTNPDVQPTGEYAFSPDAGTSLTAGTRVWLEPSPDASGWVIVSAGGSSSCCLWGGDASISGPGATPQFGTVFDASGASGYAHDFSGVSGGQTIVYAVGRVPANTENVVVMAGLTLNFSGAADGGGDGQANATATLCARDAGGTFLGFLTPRIPLFAGQYLRPSPTGLWLNTGDSYQPDDFGVTGGLALGGYAGSTPPVVRWIPSHASDVVIYWDVTVEAIGDFSSTWSGRVVLYPAGSGATYFLWQHFCCGPTDWSSLPAPPPPPPPPTTCTLAAAPTSSPAAGSALTPGQSVTFAANASGGTAPYTYGWATSDGQTATTSGPTFTAPSAGGTVWTVTVQVADSDGCVVTESLSYTTDPIVTATHAATYTTAAGVTTVLGDATSGTVSVTVDATAYDIGDDVFFQKVDSSGNLMSMTPQTGHTFDGSSSTRSLNAQWASLRLRKTGATAFAIVSLVTASP